MDLKERRPMRYVNVAQVLTGAFMLWNGVVASAIEMSTSLPGMAAPVKIPVDAINLRAGTIEQLQSTLNRQPLSGQPRSSGTEDKKLVGRVISPKMLPLKQQEAVNPFQTWELSTADKTLSSVVGRWSALAGWQLLWELPVDYAVEASTSITGTFEDAIETVANNMEKAEIPIKVIFYQGNKVLRIVAKGTD
jgi:Toxin co-regulated pilus biosynthesis protein Q